MNEKLAALKPEEATTGKEVIEPWTGGGTQTALPGNFMAEPLPAPPTPWAPIVQQIHSHKPILACEKCGAESERQAKGLCFGEECPMTLRTGWIESLIQINIDTIAAGFYGDPALAEPLSAPSNELEKRLQNTSDLVTQHGKALASPEAAAHKKSLAASIRSLQKLHGRLESELKANRAESLPAVSPTPKRSTP